MKKALIVAAAVACAATTVAVAAKKKDVPQGKVLNIYCWNEEFQSRFNDFYASKLPSDIKVNWVITPNQGNAYQNKLDEALLAQDKAKADDKIDLFLVEADYALKYVDTDFTLDVKKDIGLTDADLAQQYKYTKDVMTTTKGKKLKGVSWQACPAGFIYRRSFAKQVLGTDDPAKVQAQLNSWDKFDAVAAKMKAAGYFMLSGFDDDFRVFSDNISAPLVKGNKINIDPQIRRWVKQTKEYTDKGYNNKANLWSAESGQGAGKNGKVFGYFGPGWFIDFCLAGWAADDASQPYVTGNGSCGDWAFCEGPQGFAWGGTWICAAKGTDNAALIKDIMYTMTCDKATAKKIAEQTGDFTNNEAAMTEVANGSYKSSFLGGQNHLALLLQNAKKIDKSKVSMYDQGISEKLQAAMADYYNGKVTEDQAWNNFYTSVRELYPNLKK
ncbi:MAG: carbohydrate ABC transporter substrate-binding protein [Treponema sp.]|nr:carbohydrate ABC transporter substrate-binding protein [Treponema sp.]